MGNKDNISYKLDKIEELSFNLNDDQALLASLSTENLRVRYLIQTIINLDKHQIKIRFGLKYTKDLVDVVTFEQMYTFVMEDIHKVLEVNKDEHRLNFKVDIIPVFLSVAVGGLRGAMYEKTKHTHLAEFPMPLFNTKIIAKSNTFHVEK